MKKITIVALAILMQLSIFAQVPQGFKYQAVLRNSDGSVIVESDVELKISIIQGTVDGSSAFSETHSVATNKHGLVNVEIGSIESTSFEAIDWSNAPYFVEISIDGTVMGTSQLLSVPYALHAKTVSAINETDPVYNASIASAIQANDTASWNAKLDSFTEIDPNYNASVAANIKATDTTRWSDKSEFSGDYNDLSNTPSLFVTDSTTAFGFGTPDTTGYGNTFIGANAGATTTGEYNVFVGTDAGKLVTESYNVIIGASAADSLTNSKDNTIVGCGAGMSAKSGIANVYLGNNAGMKVDGNSNTIIGKQDWQYHNSQPNRTFNYNILIGEDAGKMVDESHNVIIGNSAADSMVNSTNNTIIGSGASRGSTSGISNVYLGNNAGMKVDGNSNIIIGKYNYAFHQNQANRTFNANILIGEDAGKNVTWGENVFIGQHSGNELGNYGVNTFVGQSTGKGSTEGWHNTYLGAYAGQKVNGGDNVIIGKQTYSPDNKTIQRSVIIGTQAGDSIESGDKNIIIGYNANLKGSSSNSVVIGDTAGGSGSYSVFVGHNAGGQVAGSYNTFVGNSTGTKSTGIGNSFFGTGAGKLNTTGNGNSFIGNTAGQKTNGNNNTILGENYYLNNIERTINGSVFIGYNAGMKETTSNKLYIDNSDTSTPLIHGDFDTDVVTINDVIKLTPRATAPTSPTMGMIYVNSADNHIYCYLGSAWVQLD